MTTQGVLSTTSPIEIKFRDYPTPAAALPDIIPSKFALPHFVLAKVAKRFGNTFIRENARELDKDARTKILDDVLVLLRVSLFVICLLSYLLTAF
jgi:hypothetical protein